MGDLSDLTGFVAAGLLLGLVAGCAPGPLLTLVVSETLRHDLRAGIKVALSPLFTDLPIIILTQLVLARLADFNQILGVISLVGGGVLVFMGYEYIRSKPPEIGWTETETGSQSLLKGVLANGLSPHPYLFWFSVGGPIMTRAMDRDVFALVGFLFSFYCLLIGSKVVLAILVGRSRQFLKGSRYRTTVQTLGVVLCLFALLLFIDGVTLMGCKSEF